MQDAGAQTEERKGSAVTEAATEQETLAGETKDSEAMTESETEPEKQTDVGSAGQSKTETVTEAAAAPGLRVINDQIIVRSEASTESEKLATLTPGMLVIAIGEDGEWTQIRFQSPDGFENGYIKTQYLNDLDQLYKVKKRSMSARKQTKNLQSLAS